MDPTTYLAAWLLAALLAIGLISAALTRHRRRLELRALQAQRLLRALQRHTAWVHAQRMAVVFRGDGQDAQAAQAALDAARSIRRTWFPELAADMARLEAVHARLLDFLDGQQALWLRDPEAWLETEHDRCFLALWRQRQDALRALYAQLEQVTSVRADDLGLSVLAPR